MKPDEIKQITVLGAGLMGHALALEFALGGYQVALYSRSAASVQRGVEKLRPAWISL